MKRNRTPNPPRDLPPHLEPSAVLLTPREVARILNVSTKRLERWRLAGIGPRAFRLAGVTVGAWRYFRRDVDAYVRECAEADAANA